MSLLTCNHSLSESILQGACPYLPVTTVLGHVVAKELYSFMPLVHYWILCYIAMIILMIVEMQIQHNAWVKVTIAMNSLNHM